MKPSIRNRIKCHRRVRAGDLVPHEWNFRAHPELQRRALAELYEQVGFARSLLAYELGDGRLKLIDGHLRRDLNPDMEVDVEILDVSDDEAKALLLSIDPLAALADVQEQIRRRLEATTPIDAPELRAAWQAAMEKGIAANSVNGEGLGVRDLRAIKDYREQFLVMIECRDEPHQVELLQRFTVEGLTCKALMS
ncbi:MAG: hypothetical protein L0Y72_08125 [Gemmataceae bacterium]|nr:hypothetical protein [Gemmataceae bacterium]MCI0738995.1 hypothetical protein [Gemmataceae bacterium]